MPRAPAQWLHRGDQLAGKLQERYGLAKDEAELQIASWERLVTDDWFTKR